MGAKDKRAKQRSGARSGVDEPSAPPVPAPVQKPDWAHWERKVDTVGKREFAVVAQEWAAHLPQIVPPGAPPTALLHSTQELEALLPLAQRSGAYIADTSGARSAVLHEAIYMLHKAVHVQIDVAEAVAKGRHTWAYVNGYQGALFALTAILGFLGLTNAKDPTGREGVVLIDVWPSEALKRKGAVSGSYNDQYKLVRFRELDHYQKWALLKRALRQTKFERKFVGTIAEALDNLGDKDHASYRNRVNYTSNCWLTADLLFDVPAGPIVPAGDLQDHYQAIYEGTANGSIYTMVALIEIACALLSEIGQIDPTRPSATMPLIAQELQLLDRRLSTKHRLCLMDWLDEP